VDENLLEHILEISRRMAETRALNPLLEYVIDEANKLVGAERGYIVLVKPNGSLAVPIKRGQDGEDLEFGEDQISKSVFHQVVETGRPLILRDAMNDPQFGDARSVAILQLRSIMCVPFVVQGETTGAIYVENRSIRNRFKEENLPPLILFANQAAVAIENAKLNDDLEDRVAARTRELEQSWAEVVEANRLRTVWLGNVTHDLRAPLGIVITTLSYTLEQELGQLNSDQTTWLSKALNAAQHVASLTDQLHDLSKLDVGGITLEREPVALDQFLHNVHSIGLGLPWPEGVTFELDINGSLPELYIDPVRIHQVLINLLSNAQKFIDQGSVTLRARYLSDKEAVLIEVTDTGEGIPEDQLGRLFQRFQQVDSDSGRRRKGSGLGLAICRELVEMHGGQIWAESEEGKGSTFIFTLPANSSKLDD